MASDDEEVSALRGCFEVLQDAPPGSDYSLIRKFGAAYAARSRDGLPSLLLPLSTAPMGAIGRRTEGLELIPHSSTLFSDGVCSWTAPAASLVCRNAELLESFAVLTLDVIRKSEHDNRWEIVVSAVESWLSLLAPKGRPTAEAELGLWGELWFLSRGDGPSRLLPAWLGPSGDSIDFLIDGVGAEIKASRVRHRHFVSQDQVDRPLGDFPTWFLSMWVKGTAGGDGLTVPALVQQVLQCSSDRGDALKRILAAGYSPADKNSYVSTFVVLEEPAWFAATHVPRVRSADPGVSRLRYQVELDGRLRADAFTATRLWQHFHSAHYDSAK